MEKRKEEKKKQYFSIQYAFSASLEVTQLIF